MTTGGIHLLLGINPDIAVFAKGIANGYPMSAVIGRREVMEAAQSTFISSTNWTERTGIAAALTTLQKHQRDNVGDHIQAIGNLIKTGWQNSAERVGLPFRIGGLSGLPHFRFEHHESPELTTLFAQIMLEKGFLASDQFKPSFAHQVDHVTEYLEAFLDTCMELAEALAWGDVSRRLKGPTIRRGFYRLT